MLYSLAAWLSEVHNFFNVFQYITLRSALAAMTSLGVALFIGPAYIRWLTNKKINQAIRDNGPKTHLIKAGTPTMGGGLILFSLILSTLLWADLSNRFIWIILMVTIGFGLIGLVDDWKKVIHNNPSGLSAKKKFFWQSVIAIMTSVLLLAAVATTNTQEFWSLLWQWTTFNFNTSMPHQVNLVLPFFKSASIFMGAIGFIVLSYFVIAGSSNAVNLTDGLDGLAIMPTVIIGAALGILTYIAGNSIYADYLFLPHIAGSGEVTIYCAALTGAGLGFLWYNAHPAQVFMGDVGALSLGAALGTIAIIARQEIVFFIMSGIFVAETITVMLQTSWFRYTRKKYGTGRRIFKKAPLHHHFEEKGWEETQVVVRFWIISIVLVLIGLSTLKIR